MRALSLDQLQALVAVVELGSFSRAAERLHLSQSAVSLQIRELETRLGLRLVDRLGKRAHASAAGLDVIAEARALLDGARRVHDAARRHRDGFVGRVRIGTGVSVLTYLLPQVLAKLARAHRGLEIVLSVGPAIEMRRRVLDNDVDLGLISAPVPERELDARSLRRDPLLAVLPPGASAAPRTLSPAQLARHPLIVEGGTRGDELVFEWLRAGGVEPAPAMRVGNIEAIKQVVAAGLGAAVLAGDALRTAASRRGLVVRPLRPAVARELMIVQRRDKPADPALRTVIDAIERELRDPPAAAPRGAARAGPGRGTRP
ncbi:MAG TPA: LysR family transcriptional regulator [Burkholderiaceae bacterium]|nr:LysR family transcriptional regulator [Burkholderiaceae bacterium]